MRNILLLAAVVVLLGISAWSQQVGERESADPYYGVLNGRTYKNEFFRLSCVIPKGFNSQLELLESLRKSKNLVKDGGLERAELEFRRQGFLLNVTPKIQVAFPQVRQGGVPMRDGIMRYDITFEVPSTSLAVLASPVDAQTSNIGIVIEQRVQQLRAATHDQVVLGEPTPTIIGAQTFQRIAYVVPANQIRNSVKLYASEYGILKKGYVLVFQFVAPSEKDLTKLERFMGTVTINPEHESNLRGLDSLVIP